MRCGVGASGLIHYRLESTDNVLLVYCNRDREGPPLDWCTVHADRQRYVPEAWINAPIADPNTLPPDELVSLYMKLYDAQHSGGAFEWKVAV